MDIGAWATISQLLDEALDLPPAERDAWLDGLAPEHAALLPRLRAMLARAATADDGFLAALPPLSAVDDAPGALRLTAGHAGALVGPYRLVRELASGGQGAVWFAERSDGRLTRPVAVKLPIGLAFRPHLAERMAREGQILASLTHPHIARLYDAGVAADGAPYLAMEYVDGVAVDQHCATHRLDIAARVRLFVTVVRAVAFAHARLVIHRDLKPSNILVTADGDVRLLDFGIAKLLDEARPAASTLTEEGGRAMTLRYASPEQVAQQPLGVATDVYSLGVVLYELLAGVPPYQPARDTVAALEEAVLAAEPRRPSDAAADATSRRVLRGDLDTIVLKALKKAPEERYATAGDLADDLTRYLEGHPVVAQPDRRWYRLRKFVGRHRAETAVAAAALLAVLAGTGVAVWQARVAQREAARAEAVKDFIASMFRDVDPNVRPAGRPLAASDVLELARPRIATELADHPEARSELMRILGESLMSVGSPGPAIEILREALDDTRRRAGPDAPETIDTALMLAAAGQYDTRSDEALTVAGEVFDRLGRSGRGRTVAAVRARLIQARVLVTRGRATDELEQYAREARDLAVEVLGPSHAVTADAFSTSSAAFRMRGKRDVALADAEASHRAYIALYGADPRHPRIIQAQNMLGRALYEVDRTAEAIRHLKEAAANGAELYRDNGPYLQQLLGTLANIQLSYGELKEALANIEKALAADLGGVRLSETYLAGQDLVHARALLAMRRPAEAIRKQERALARLAGTTGGPVPTLLVEHAAALVAVGRFDDASRTLAPLVARRAEPLTLLDRQVLVQQAAIAAGQRRPARAIDDLRLAGAFTPASGAGRLTLTHARLLLGTLLLDARQFDEAERMLRDAETVVAGVQGVVTPLRADIMVALGRVDLARGRQAAAVEHFRAAETFWRDFDPGHDDARAAAAWLERARRATS